jgi:hypothetical protein
MWIWKGPFTPLFRRFLFSNIRFTSKVTVISYIGTYYAIGAAWILTTVNYFIMGWFNGYLDKYYVDSWQVWFSIIIVFNGLGNVALAVMRYRVGERNLLYALFENFKWTFLLAIFLGGLSLHVSQALLAHMFEIDMTWGATSKEAEFSNFFIEVPKVLKKVSSVHLFHSSDRPLPRTNKPLNIPLPGWQLASSLKPGQSIGYKLKTLANTHLLTVQILDDLLHRLHRRHDHSCRRALCAARLAHHRLRRNSPHGHCHRFPFPPAAGSQPGSDDVLVVNGKQICICRHLNFFFRLH